MLRKGKRRLDLANKFEKYFWESTDYVHEPDTMICIKPDSYQDVGSANPALQRISINMNKTQFVSFAQGDEEVEIMLERFLVHEYAHNIDPLIIIKNSKSLIKHFSNILPDDALKPTLFGSSKDTHYLQEKYAVTSADDVCAAGFGEGKREVYGNASTTEADQPIPWKAYDVDGRQSRVPFTRCDILRDYLDTLLENMAEGLETGELKATQFETKKKPAGWYLLLKRINKLDQKDISSLTHPTDKIYYELALQKEMPKSKYCHPSSFQSSWVR